MTTKVFKQISPTMEKLGFRLNVRGKEHAQWVREAHTLTRQEVGIQDSSLDKDQVIATLRISIHSTVWSGIEKREIDDDEFSDALTREWGANGIFYYGWQRWEGWRLDDAESLIRDLHEKALPWLDLHCDPKHLITVLENEVTKGYRAGPVDEPGQRKFFGRLLLGRNYPQADRLVFPLGHKERIGDLYYGLGDLPNAIRWLRAWLADRPKWNQRERYERRIEEIEARLGGESGTHRDNP